MLLQRDQNSPYHWTRMRRSLARFSGPVSLIRAQSLADSTITTFEFRFSVHTGVPVRPHEFSVGADLLLDIACCGGNIRHLDIETGSPPIADIVKLLEKHVACISLMPAPGDAVLMPLIWPSMIQCNKVVRQSICASHPFSTVPAASAPVAGKLLRCRCCCRRSNRKDRGRARSGSRRSDTETARPIPAR